MMLIMRDTTPCGICNRPLKHGDAITAFPSIVVNENDPLYQFNESAFHRECFESHPLAEEAMERIREWEAKITPAHMCYLCGQRITNPDDHYIFPDTTRDHGSPFFEYNFAECHRECLRKWEMSPRILAHMKELRASGQWKGIGVDWAIADLEAILAARDAT